MNHEHHLHGALASPTPPPGVADDWTVPQHWDELTAGDHWVWDTLFSRQQSLLHGRAVTAFERGLDVLHLSRPGVPNFDEVNDKLYKRTGFSVVGLPGSRIFRKSRLAGRVGPWLCVMASLLLVRAGIIKHPAPAEFKPPCS